MDIRFAYCIHTYINLCTYASNHACMPCLPIPHAYSHAHIHIYIYIQEEKQAQKAVAAALPVAQHATQEVLSLQTKQEKGKSMSFGLML